jgi:hypothetical protein
MLFYYCFFTAKTPLHLRSEVSDSSSMTDAIPLILADKNPKAKA